MASPGSSSGSSSASAAGSANGPAEGSAPGSWLHLNVATIAATASEGDKIHTWPAANDAGKGLIAHNTFGFTDVEFKTSGPFSGRPAMLFTGKHFLCTASAHAVPQELTVFWKGTFDSTGDPAHPDRINWASLIEQDSNWRLRRHSDGSDGSKMIMYVGGKNSNGCVGESASKEPVIIVGTVAGVTRTISVYRDSDMSHISTVTTSDGDPMKQEDKKICMGFQEHYYGPDWDFTAFHGEVEQVVVYDKLLGQQDIMQVANSLHNQQVPTAVA